MKHIIINKQSSDYRIAVLLPNTAFTTKITDKFFKNSFDISNTIAFNLKDLNDKVPVKLAVSYINILLPALDLLKIEYLYVANSTYFKKLTGIKNIAMVYGAIKACTIKGFEHFKVVLGINPKSIYFNPALLLLKVNQGIEAINADIKGTYKEVGANVVHSSHYPNNLTSIENTLNDLLSYPELCIDIEAKSLLFWKAGIESIAFSWNAHNGVSFLVDRLDPNIKKLLKNFFINYKGKTIWHNAAYDLKVLIYELWMTNLLDNSGIIEGIRVLTKNFGDTQVETYLSVNSCAGNILGLKPNTQEYMGDYAEDCTDTSLIADDTLLIYNLKDAIATFWLHKKMYLNLIKDKQEEMYIFMLNSIKLLLHVELVGMPINMQRVGEVKKVLQRASTDALKHVTHSNYIKSLVLLLRQEESDICHSKWKKKTAPIINFNYITFNINSGKHIGSLLHNIMSLPILTTTPTGIPKTGTKELEILKNYTDSTYKISILNNLIKYSKATKILSTFIPAFEKAIKKEDGHYYLHGNFKVTGTVSGRLSSNSPNLQNLPSGSEYGKLIKSCFEPPKEYLWVFSDYNSLESVVNAKITQDPNKLKVLIEGYDSHSFNTYYYWKDKFSNLTLNPDSLNTIKKTHPTMRNESKPVTFALQYFAEFGTLMVNSGFSKKEAKSIFSNYHTLYQVSDDWAADKMKQAELTGFVEGCFGLRVRTPVIQQSLMGSKCTTSAAKAEYRSAGNALTQSYCMLNSRSAIEFMNRVYVSKYADDIKPIALIHDALYLIIRNDIDVLHWVNINLAECMSWNNLDELKQDNIPLGGELDLCYPTWDTSITIPNNENKTKILELTKELL